MTEQNELQPGELKDLADLTDTLQREKVELSPEMKKYFDETLARFTEGMTKGEMPVKKDLDEFVNKLKQWIKMSKEYREKYPSIEAMEARSIELVTKMKLEKSYDEMVDTLQNYGYTDTIPDKQTVMKAILNLGPQMLENIKKFKRPTILMTPKGDLASKIQKLDTNKKYSDSNGQQGDTYFEEPPTSSLWGPEPAKLTVTIVDGAPEMPKLPADKVDLRNEEKHKYLTKKYKRQGMKMISAHEYAMLAQKSLRAYERNQDEKEIIDVNTVTYLNAEHLTDLQKVPYARFHSNSCRVLFASFRPLPEYANIRGRPSVQVL